MTATLSFEPVIDRPAIHQTATLADTIWREHFPKVISRAQIDYMLTHLQSPGAIAQQIKQGATYELVTLGQSPIGYLAYEFRDANTGKISKLYLLHEHRRRGYGLTMIQHIEHLARHRHLASLWLQTNRNNHNSIAFYKRCGYSLLREQCTDIGQGFFMDDYIFARQLPNPGSKQPS